MNQFEGRQLVVSGSIAFDSINKVPEGERLTDHLKTEGDGISVSLFVGEQVNRWGGTGANISRTAAMLGAEPVLLGSLGIKDVAYLEQLELIGVITKHCYLSERFATAAFVAAVDDFGSQLGLFYPGAMSDSEAGLTLLPWKDQSALAIISPHDPTIMRRQIEECVDMGIPYCFDIGQQVDNTTSDFIDFGVSRASVLIANDSEMVKIAKSMKITLEELKERLPLIVTTRGGDGADIEGSLVTEKIHIPAARVDKVVDPTGAGDSFRGGFFAALVSGKSLEEAGAWGAVAGAYAVEVKGGQEHKFTRKEFETRLAEYYEERMNEFS